jgi:hypothetical protein
MLSSRDAEVAAAENLVGGQVEVEVSCEPMIDDSRPVAGKNRGALARARRRDGSEGNVDLEPEFAPGIPVAAELSRSV